MKKNLTTVVILIPLLLILNLMINSVSGSNEARVYAAQSKKNSGNDVFIHLPFDGDVTNMGTSEVEPKKVGTLKEFETGIIKQALHFDTNYAQVNQNNPAPYIDLGDHDDLKFGDSTDFSISFWLRFPDLSKTDGWPAIISNKGGKEDVGWQIITDSYENIRWQLTVEGHEPFAEVTVGRIQDTNWHHFAVTHERDGFARFYIDGKEIADQAMDLSGKKGSVDSELTPKIGVTGKGILANQTRDKLNILLDDMRIYRHALNEQEIVELTEMQENIYTLIMLEDIAAMQVDDKIIPSVYGMKFNKDIEKVQGKVEFESSDSSVATITEDGEILAKNPGETEIKVTIGGSEDSIHLTVKEKIEKEDWQKQLRLDHPRLIATTEDFEELKLKIENNSRSAMWFENIQKQADELMTENSYNGRDPQRILLLGMMYQLTDDHAYVDRAWLELEQLFESSWDPDMFLEMSERLVSASLAYDWFYHGWTEEQRNEIKRNMIEKGVMPGILTYRLGDEAPYDTNYWLGRVNPDANNWNTVGNSGQLISALAIGDEEPYLANEIMDNGMTDILYSLEKFNPDGGWFEGVSYWNYTWIYLVRLLGSIDTALGEENNQLSSFPGLSESGYFPIYLTGPTEQAFNFGDSTPDIGEFEQMYYLADRYKKPEYTQFQIPFSEKSKEIDPLSLLWYNPEHESSDGTSHSLDKVYSDIEIGAMRQSWDDKDGLFISFKAGAPQNGHMDLDAGSFVLDALGERWFADLGDRNRSEWPNYFSTYGPRWTYYTKRAEGHNTLVLNPKPATGIDGDPDQTFIYNGDYKTYSSPIETLESYKNQAFSIMNLTNAYTGSDALSVRRGIALLDNRTQIVLQDEIELKDSGEIYSFLHFNGKAEATIEDDGQSAVLSIGEKRLWIGLLDPQDGDVIDVMDAKPLDTSPNPDIQHTKPGTITEETPVKKLTVHLKNRENARITLLIIPLESGEEYPSDAQFPAVAPLSEWENVYAENDITTPVLQDLQNLINDFKEKDDIQVRFATQLEYRLDIIGVLLEQNEVTQAVAYMEDFCNHITDQSVLTQKLISEDASDKLEEVARELIDQWID